MELLNKFSIVFSSIVIEALPFILIGAVLASFMQVYISNNIFNKIKCLTIAFRCGQMVIARKALDNNKIDLDAYNEVKNNSINFFIDIFSPSNIVICFGICSITNVYAYNMHI